MKNPSVKLTRLEERIRELYASHDGVLPFHGWLHVGFVSRASAQFCAPLCADPEIVTAAALTHDLNFVIAPRSSPEIAAELRSTLLRSSGYEENEIDTIESVILDACTTNRSANISQEAKALSDADTLYKALPITPILFTRDFMIENDMSLLDLASRIVELQQPLLEEGIYFYSDIAKDRYLRWAKTNLQLWKNVLELAADTGLSSMLDQRYYNHVLAS